MKNLAKLLLPLTGVTEEIVEGFKPTILDVGFKYEREGVVDKKYAIFIRIRGNVGFIRYLRDALRLLNMYEEPDNIWVVELVCLEEYMDDWKLFLMGKYSKISFSTRSIILHNCPEDMKDEWERIMRKQKSDIIEHIVSKLDPKKNSLAERKKIAEELYKGDSEGSLDKQELHKKPHLTTI